ncbi:hypothetical protein [Paenibacillus sp. S150]|uniref:hypothetical protein n=1 Tax=Paenibacillus sp. S150 TaxID=2749826 RepID=UPI001C588F52|nr:hypothetical protein [Paenibacillus sp. S150]MBW4085045.1 hypothetical protein [Paenibacillus sp. S150]
MKSKILPMKRQDLFATYNIDASFLSMALAYESTEPWIYGNFIQIKGFKGNPQSYFYECQHNRDTPFFLVQRLGKDLLNTKWKDIIQFIIECIDLNYYILMMINKSYLSVYQNTYYKDYLHDIFIYGYDLEQEIIYFAGSALNGKYSMTSCSFEEFRTAYVQSDKDGLFDWLYGIVLYQYRNTEMHKVNPDLRLQIKTLLTHYIESTHMCLFDFSTTAHYDREQLLFGFDVYRNLIDYINKGGFEQLDIRPFSLFLDHKKIMLQRFKYFNSNQYIEEQNIDLGSLVENVQLAEIHWVLALRYNLTKEEKIKEKIIEHLSRFMEKEYEVYSRIISIL